MVRLQIRQIHDGHVTQMAVHQNLVIHPVTTHYYFMQILEGEGTAEHKEIDGSWTSQLAPYRTSRTDIARHRREAQFRHVSRIVHIGRQQVLGMRGGKRLHVRSIEIGVQSMRRDKHKGADEDI